MVPGLHLLRELAARKGRLEHLLWLTSGRPIEQLVLAELADVIEPGRWQCIDLGLEAPGGGAPSIRRKLSRAMPSALRVWRVLRAERCDVLLGLGGWICAPALVGAKLAGVPSALLEINAQAGSVTRSFGSAANKVLHAWPRTMPARSSPRHVLCGAPVGPRFAPPGEGEQKTARRDFGFEPARPLLLVLGGSQGAAPLNRFIDEHAQALIEAGWSILHQTGPGKLGRGAGPRWVCKEYLQDMPRALRAASLVLCRAGGSSLAEIAAVRVPAWAVPYPQAKDRHQDWNAKALGPGVRVIPQEDLGPGVAQDLIDALGPDGLAKLDQQALALGQVSPSGAALRIWQELEGLAQR